MVDTTADMTARRNGERRGAIWAAYAACAWALLFALMSFYWAAGGVFGANTLGSAIQALAHDPGFIAVVWLTGVAKVFGGLFALALARPSAAWARWLPSGWRLALAWVGGVALALYGGVQFIIEGLALGGVLHASGPVDWTGLRWHVWLWDPWWLLGGILFLLAAWQYQRSQRARHAEIHAEIHAETTAPIREPSY